MCGRYWIAEKENPQEMLRVIEALNHKRTPETLKTSGEIFPADIVPVLANSRKGDVQPFAMRWGYSFPGGRPIINARAETAADKPMFRDGMKQRRCLIPMSSYYEWERRGNEKIKYAIRPQEGGMAYLAGIYHLERHGEVVVPAFAVLTREAAPEIRFIHERMPVILAQQRALEWLDCRNSAQDVIAQAAVQMAFCGV